MEETDRTAPDETGERLHAGCNRRVQRRTPRANALTAATRQRFLDVVAATANVQRAATVAGVSQASFYRLRQRDAAFAEAWRVSVEDGYAALEAKVLATALAEQACGDPDRGRAADAEDGAAAPFDVKVALDVLRRRDAQVRAPGERKQAAGYRYMPVGEVERSLLAKLDAMDRRIAATAARNGDGEA